MQPTFMPWLGYFELIYQSELFIFLDDVQLSPKSFQIRNRIPCDKNAPNFIWLTIHEDKNLPFNQRLLNNTFLADARKDFRAIRSLLSENYKHGPKLDSLLSILSESLKSSNSIADLNIELIKFFCLEFQIDTPFLRSSNLDLADKNPDKVIKILDSVGFSNYLCVPGSLEYMIPDEKWTTLLPKVLKFIYAPRPYQQSSLSNFMPFMSIVDVYLNLEKKLAIETIHGGFIELMPVT
jgi:hypothetical protein